jgi:hypothetical protein
VEIVPVESHGPTHEVKDYIVTMIHMKSQRSMSVVFDHTIVLMQFCKVLCKCLDFYLQRQPITGRSRISVIVTFRTYHASPLMLYVTDGYIYCSSVFQTLWQFVS